MKKRLVLKSETMLDLSDTEMAAVGGGAELLTQACVLTWVCISVKNCVTTNCTYTAAC